MNPSVRARYWKIVRACLVELYGHSSQAAEAEIREFRRSLSGLDKESNDPLAGEMIYHEEALTIAGDLANSNLRRADLWPQYVEILNRHVLPVRVAARKRPSAVGSALTPGTVKVSISR